MNRGQTIVVTGGSGYIGSALRPALRAAGYATRLVSRTMCDDGKRGEAIVADLRTAEAWSDLLNSAAGVIHLSSRTDLRAAEADAEVDEDLNVAPVRALIEAQQRRRGSGLPVVFASTVTIFGDAPPLPCDESAPDRPLSVYDRHKLAGEVLLRQATQQGTLAACTLRLANVYGCAASHCGTVSTNRNRGILNVMMARALGGELLNVYGTGEYVRDFIHVDDVVSAFVAAIGQAQAQDGSAYVIATGKGHSLLEAFSMVAREATALTGLGVDVRNVPEPVGLHRSERRNFIGNANLFSSRTGWRPRVEFGQGIRSTLGRMAPLHVTGSRG